MAGTSSAMTTADIDELLNRGARPTGAGGRGRPVRAAAGLRGGGGLPKPKKLPNGCAAARGFFAAVRLRRRERRVGTPVPGARGIGGAAARRRVGDRHIALGLFAADLAARPGEIIGAAGGRRQRLALHQRARGERIDRGRPRAGTAEQLIASSRWPRPAA